MKKNELIVSYNRAMRAKMATLFKKVCVSKLSLNDDFMKHSPRTENEKRFKEEVKKVIEAGVSDFWRPTIDPSLAYSGITYNWRICYEPGKTPAVGKSYEWWIVNAKKFNPKCGSRLGTKSEYVAFLATLIKELVAYGKSIEWAWNAVCNDSKELGHYWNSKDAKHNFEPTGSREVCGWYDLANTSKILAEDEDADGFWLAGGDYFDDSDDNPLADLYVNYYRDSDCFYSCGWLVFDRCFDC